jgi:plasmid stability protein
MEDAKRATIYFDATVHQALRLKAAASNRSISAMVNDAVRASLAEDADDQIAAESRQAEQSISFESFVQELRSSGRL